MLYEMMVGSYLQDRDRELKHNRCITRMLRVIRAAEATVEDEAAPGRRLRFLGRLTAPARLRRAA
jgi:hypothetical protein